MPWVILIAIAPEVFVLRLYRLTEIPPGISCGEGAHDANALQVLRGEHTVFFPKSGDGLEGLSAYAVALSTTLLGRGVLAIRRPSVAASDGAFLTVFWLGKAFFGEDENGITISLCGQLVAGVTLRGAELSGIAHRYVASQMLSNQLLRLEDARWLLVALQCETVRE